MIAKNLNDPAILSAALMIGVGYTMSKSSVNIRAALLHNVDIETDTVLNTVRGIEGVTGIHHAYFWQMDERGAALDAHVVIGEKRRNAAHSIKERIKAVLSDRFGVEHTIRELECTRHACNDPAGFGGNGHWFQRATQHATVFRNPKALVEFPLWVLPILESLRKTKPYRPQLSYLSNALGEQPILQKCFPT